MSTKPRASKLSPHHYNFTFKLQQSLHRLTTLLDHCCVPTAATMTDVVTKIEVDGLKKIASGKVREIFEVDEEKLLFVATDRISAYDVILDNVSLIESSHGWGTACDHI